MMARAAVIALVGLGLAGATGCSHTHAVEQAPPPAEEPGKSASPPAAEKPKAAAHPARSGAGVPVATSADALLVPGGEDQIREKLKANGSLAGDASLAEGLRKFQEDHDLPATGMPDHQTVAKLGLDPEKIFRQAQKKD